MIKIDSFKGTHFLLAAVLSLACGCVADAEDVERTSETEQDVSYNDMNKVCPNTLGLRHTPGGTPFMQLTSGTWFWAYPSETALNGNYVSGRVWYGSYPTTPGPEGWVNKWCVSTNCAAVPADCWNGW